MKTTKTKNKIFGFLSKTSVKKFALILYVTVPLLIFATGFAAWTIIGHEIKTGPSGSFVADGIINSYDYIELQGGSNGLTNINLFPTGFVSDGKVTNQATIEVTYTLKNAACQELVEGNNDNNKTLYADFTLMFLNGSGYSAFFDNLSCDVTYSATDGSYKPLPKDFTKIDFYTTNDPNYSNYGAINFKKNASFKVMLVFNPTETAYLQDGSGNGNITLKFRYTVAPSAGDFQTIYNTMVDKNLEPMIDVRITDVAPTTNAQTPNSQT